MYSTATASIVNFDLFAESPLFDVRMHTQLHVDYFRFWWQNSFSNPGKHKPTTHTTHIITVFAPTVGR